MRIPPLTQNSGSLRPESHFFESSLAGGGEFTIAKKTERNRISCPKKVLVLAKLWILSIHVKYLARARASISPNEAQKFQLHRTF